MTPDQQQRAIEKACGWIIANPENDRADYRHWTPPNCVARPKYMYLDRPPNYLGDLNACHEMEKVLTGDQQHDYECHLLRMDYPDWEIKVTHATAAQRSEAFLRTLNLWTPIPTQPQ
jgi:hypothetical protein